MNGSERYEKIVKVSIKGRQLAKLISAVMAYVLLFALWLMAAINNSSKFIYIIAAGLLCVAIVVLLTWKYLFLEYEYSFFCGIMSVAKIYGKRKRKELFSTNIKDLLIIASANDENINRAEQFKIEDRIVAVSDERADDIWLAVSGGKDEKRVLVFFEADERSLAALKKINPYSFVKNN